MNTYNIPVFPTMRSTHEKINVSVKCNVKYKDLHGFECEVIIQADLITKNNIQSFMNDIFANILDKINTIPFCNIINKVVCITVQNVVLH